MICTDIQGAAKSSPLTFIVVLSETDLNFNAKFYAHISDLMRTLQLYQQIR